MTKELIITLRAMACEFDGPELDEAADALEAAQAEIADAKRMLKYYSDYCNLMAKERDAALARLAGLAKQEPVSYRYRFAHPISGHPVWRSESITWNGQCVQEVQPLFAAAGASPQPSQARELSDEEIDAAVEAWFKRSIQGGPRPFAGRMKAAFAAINAKGA